jgi:hypothetical protein
MLTLASLRSQLKRMPEYATFVDFSDIFKFRGKVGVGQR